MANKKECLFGYCKYNSKGGCDSKDKECPILKELNNLKDKKMSSPSQISEG